MSSQRGDTEKVNLIEEGKKQVMNLLITVQSLKYRIMLPY